MTERTEPPVVISRWVLTVKYSMFALLGVVAGAAGIPTLSLTTWAGYTTVWSALIALSGVVAAFASTKARREPIEKWAAVALTSLLSVYVVSALVLSIGSGQVGRAALAVVLAIVTLLPGWRAGSLLLRTGLPRA